MTKIVVIVATHKKYRMPNDSMYLPVQVGAENKADIGYVKDNTGENISIKNPNFCELTGLYWLWKNVPAEYIGLVHYRRYFVSKRGFDKWKCIASQNEIEDILRHIDVILPHERNYYIETTYSQYAHAHHRTDLDMTRKIIVEKYPQYVDAFDSCMERTSGHKFNMFIMKRAIADKYCAWLFDILFELDKRLDISEYSPNDARAVAFVAERLLDVWIKTNGVSYKELPVLFMEKQNWVVKGTKFLGRKFEGQRC
ncbi:MAG: DUF4422 domain-containing protein [Clostridiales bacterium]|nr:DUF4422 domain-containing protein [Clostridiales bacterium]